MKLLLPIYIFLLFSLQAISIINASAEDGYDTIARLNFCYSDDQTEPGWTNITGNNSFPVELEDGIQVSVSGGILQGGTAEGLFSMYPATIGSTYNTIAPEASQPVTFTFTGLNPGSRYTFEIFSGCLSDSVNDVKTTTFFGEDHGKANDGEFLIIDDTYTYSDNMNGFKYWRVGNIDNPPADWTSPYDYERGEIYQRYEIISMASERTAKFQFGFWQDGPYGDYNPRETFSSFVAVDGPGAFSTYHSSPSTWWELDGNKPVDFSRPADFSSFGVPLRSDDNKIISRISGSEYDWDIRTEYHPLTVRATIVAVALGSQFSGWSKWVGSTVTINSAGNTDSLLVLSLSPRQDGEIKITMSKTEGLPGYINAMTIKRSLTSELTIDITGKGTVNYPSGTYENNVPLTLTATADQGWEFSGWEGDTTITSPTITVDMAMDKHLVANFKYTMPENIVARVNFTFDSNYDEDGWTNVHGSAGLPADLGNGITLTHNGSPMIGATTGQAITMLAPNVGSTSAVFDVAYSDSVEFILSGLNPDHSYSLYVFSSRRNNDIPLAIRRTSFSIGTDTVVVNSVGNQYKILEFDDVSPDASGEISLMMQRYESYGYINALILADNDFTPTREIQEIQNKVLCYPLPVKDKLVVENIPAGGYISLITMSGCKVVEKQNSIGNRLLIEMGHLAPGMYLLRATKEEMTIGNIKILKE